MLTSRHATYPPRSVDLLCIQSDARSLCHVSFVDQVGGDVLFLLNTTSAYTACGGLTHAHSRQMFVLNVQKLSQIIHCAL